MSFGCLLIHSSLFHLSLIHLSHYNPYDCHGASPHAVSVRKGGGSPSIPSSQTQLLIFLVLWEAQMETTTLRPL